MFKNREYIISFFLMSSSLVIADLIHPENGDELNYVHVLFEWEQEPDAIGYNLQVSTEQHFNSLLLDVDDVTNVYVDKDNINWNNTYYWRVRPIYDNEDSVYGDWIDQSSFSTGGTTFQNINVNIYDGDLLEDGYVAISGFFPGLFSIIIDKDGKKDFTEHNWEGNNVLLFGSEGYGLKYQTSKNSDFLLKIAINKKIESLNISNSAAIVFHYINNSRKNV